jgi:hypothetical protein
VVVTEPLASVVESSWRSNELKLKLQWLHGVPALVKILSHTTIGFRISYYKSNECVVTSQPFHSTLVNTKSSGKGKKKDSSTTAMLPATNRDEESNNKFTLNNFSDHYVVKSQLEARLTHLRQFVTLDGQIFNEKIDHAFVTYARGGRNDNLLECAKLPLQLPGFASVLYSYFETELKLTSHYSSHDLTSNDGRPIRVQYILLLCGCPNTETTFVIVICYYFVMMYI